jgi:hypothetical protein
VLERLLTPRLDDQPPSKKRKTDAPADKEANGVTVEDDEADAEDPDAEAEPADEGEKTADAPAAKEAVKAPEAPAATEEKEAKAVAANGDSEA